MVVDGAWMSGYRCFDDWSGFAAFRPVTVVIGKNNSGKSQLLDFVEALCRTECLPGSKHRFSAVLGEDDLRGVFRPGRRDGQMPGDWWDKHGSVFVGRRVVWTTRGGQEPSIDDFDDEPRWTDTRHQVPIETVERERRYRITSLLGRAKSPLSGTAYRRLRADRDIKPEPETNDLTLGDGGEGATNIIRRFLVSSSGDCPREVVRERLLEAMNQVFKPDCHFTEIYARQHDNREPERLWEVYLGEDEKGLIPLSQSGSGLKTVLLVLLNLLVMPVTLKRDPREFTFAFEELENNLHPSLVRRLLRYLEEHAVREGARLFLTTHSSTALDLFSISPHAQIVHVTHTGRAATVSTLSAYSDLVNVVGDIGAKPSDLLQANGVVWVEGPSDRIYINHWIRLLAGDELQEGRDYQCAFYGGALLARTQFTSLADAEEELANLLRLCGNVVVVCDSDRANEKARVKDRVRRIRREVNKIGSAHIWVTKCREVENYIPSAAWEKVFEGKSCPDPGPYEIVVPGSRRTDSSYIQRVAGRNTYDKVDLAVESRPGMTIENMQSRFDWMDEMSKVVKRIREWNA